MSYYKSGDLVRVREGAAIYNHEGIAIRAAPKLDLPATVLGDEVNIHGVYYVPIAFSESDRNKMRMLDESRWFAATSDLQSSFYGWLLDLWHGSL